MITVMAMILVVDSVDDAHSALNTICCAQAPGRTRLGRRGLRDAGLPSHARPPTPACQQAFAASDMRLRCLAGESMNLWWVHCTQVAWPKWA